MSREGEHRRAPRDEQRYDESVENNNDGNEGNGSHQRSRIGNVGEIEPTQAGKCQRCHDRMQDERSTLSCTSQPSGRPPEAHS